MTKQNHMAAARTYQLEIPVHDMADRQAKRVRRSNDSGARIVEAYFAVLTIVIVAMIVGIAAYTIHYVIPDLQRSHSPRTEENPQNIYFHPQSSQRR